jgi:hypothetical protein
MVVNSESGTLFPTKGFYVEVFELEKLILV